MEIKKRNRKIYSKPELEVVKVDHEISMVMMTDPGDPDSDLNGAAMPEMSETTQPVQTYQSSSESNPFGGSSPFEN